MIVTITVILVFCLLAIYNNSPKPQLKFFGSVILTDNLTSKGMISLYIKNDSYRVLS